MAIRLPGNGDSQKAEQEEIVGPQLKFPTGTQALFVEKLIDGKTKRVPMAESDKVTLVNVSLATVYIRDRDYSIESADKKHHEVSIKMLPGASHELTVQYARRALQVQERQGEIGFELHVYPPAGDCQAKWKFKAFNKTWRTCPYGECKTCGPLPPNVRWSIWQSQHRVARLGSAEAIDLWIEKLDPRPEVMLWGLRHSKAREERRQENMGLRTTRTEEDTVN